MAMFFEEVDYQKTPLGELVLRRRSSPSVPDDLVYEVTLNDEMLMSSTVNESERALARLALEDGRADRPLDVLVGGLGLGHTAAEVLSSPSVRRLEVVELLRPVIRWHRERLVPLADTLMDDPRCTLVEGDFFEHVGPENSEQYDVILLDIDHAPDCLLHARHGDFYRADGLHQLADHLRPDGVFGVWSAWEPPEEFTAALQNVFASVHEHEVAFFNPHTDRDDSNWILLAEGPEGGGTA